MTSEIYAMKEKMEESNLSNRAFLVYNCLLEYCGKGKRTCYPSVTTIAKKIRSCVRTVQRALNELIATGWVTRTARFSSGKNGAQTSNLYEVKIGTDREVPARNPRTSHAKAQKVEETPIQIPEKSAVSCEKSALSQLKLFFHRLVMGRTHSSHPLNPKSEEYLMKEKKIY